VVLNYAPVRSPTHRPTTPDLTPAMTTFVLSAGKFQQFLSLTKPRVTLLAVFTAMIGMFLGVPAPELPSARAVIFGSLGIGLLAGAAFAINCLIEQHIDAKMVRTRARPLPRGVLTIMDTLVFAFIIGALGMLILHEWVNPLTMWLTLGTFVGYAVIYTVILKPATPQNIVIGGASGAMPPVLGWAAATGTVSPEALILFLIIFVWTPPHFWALALFRTDDYRKSGLPMLPVTHGSEFTRLHIVLYTVALVAVTMLPFAIRMSGWIYLVSALALGAVFLVLAVNLQREYSDGLSRRTFRYSIVYLALLFMALLVDHYLLW
jgi:protoheme IX farnesyltransferase